MADFAPDTFRYRVRSTAAVTPVVRELRLEPVDDPMPFAAGQFVLLADAHDRIPQRSYSVANAPRGDGLLSLLVTRVPGGPTSTWAHGLAAGTEVAVEGPFGTFVLPRRTPTGVLLLGAGSGLAPLRALAEGLLGPVSKERVPVTLFFSGRTEADAIDHARFEDWAARWSMFDYWLTCTRDPAALRHRRIPDILLAECENLSGYEVFTAGPPGFVAGCAAAAITLGADPAAVHTEEFFVDPAAPQP